MASLAADLIWKDELVENGSVESVSLSDYVGVVWRRKWIVIIVTLLVGGAAAIYAKHQQTLYASTSQVLSAPSASQQNSQTTNKNAASGTFGTDNVELASTPGFAQFVLLRIHLHDRSPADLQNQTTVAPTATGNGLQFTVSDHVAATAFKLASAMANQYPAYVAWQDVKTEISNLTNQVQQDQAEVQNPKAYGLYKTGANGNILLFDASGNLITNGASGGKPEVDTGLVATKQYDAESKLAKISTLNKSELTITGNGDMISRVGTSPVKTQPAVTKTVIIGIFAGFILGVILAFLQDVLDTRIRDVAGVGRRLRLPLLSQIPSPPKNLKGLVSMAEPGPALMHSAEAYRIGKLNLAAAIDRAGARSVMFTSGNNGEGASQTVANLAVVMARSGKHVILVDANMRHSEQGDFFGLDDRAGLSDVLSGNAKLADALTAVDVSRTGGAMISEDGTQRGGLEVLPAGSRAGDPAELLDSAAARDLIVALEERADLVLVDAPALLPVTDAMVLSSKVDAVVVVARAHRASRPTIVALRRALDACPARAIGFVFTGASLGRRFDYGGSFAAGTSGKTTDEFDPREIGVL
jgi:capsular exopolysaccharide synthesis family protein